MLDEFELDRTYERLPAEVLRRIVFLGSSSTDGDTYPQLLRTALEDAGVTDIRTINAGVGGNSAEQMLARLTRDVLNHLPTLVIIQAGMNNLSPAHSIESFRAAVRGMIEAMRVTAEIVLMAPNELAGKTREDGQAKLDQIDAALRRLSDEYRLPLAEAGRAQRRQARDTGIVQVEGDGLHATYDGQRGLTRALLDAMGYPEANVPARARNSVLPGVVSPWRIRPMVEEMSFDLNAKPDETWLMHALPETTPVEALWLDDLRGMGMSVGLKGMGNVTQIQAVAEVESNSAQEVTGHVGADVQEVYVNGQRVYDAAAEEFLGFHIDRSSFPVALRPGRNTFVMRSGLLFFLSLTQGDLHAAGVV